MELRIGCNEFTTLRRFPFLFFFFFLDWIDFFGWFLLGGDVLLGGFCIFEEERRERPLFWVLYRRGEGVVGSLFVWSTIYLDGFERWL